MQIEAALDFEPRSIETNFSLNFVNLRMHEPRCVFPSTIEIKSRYVASKITIDDTIDVNHGINFNNVIFQQPLGVFIWFRNQFSNHALNHIRWPDFTWMLPRHNNDHFLLLFFRFPTNCHFRNIIPTQRSAYRFNAKLQSIERVLLGNKFGFFEETNHFTIAIRQGHSYENIVIFVIESKIERQAIEFCVGQLLYINWGLLIDNVPCPPTPAFALGPGFV